MNVTYTPSIQKKILELPMELIHTLQAALFNQRTLNANWIKNVGWRVCHTDDAFFNRFLETTFIRYCQKNKITSLIAANTVNIFSCINGKLIVRMATPNHKSIFEIMYGFPSSASNNLEFEWLNSESYSSTLLFNLDEVSKFLILRDFSTCTTIAGDSDFIEHMIGLSKTIWYDGVPMDGYSFGGNRTIVKPKISRSKMIQDYKKLIKSTSKGL